MLIKDPNKRFTLEDIMNHDWVTVYGKFPLSKSEPKKYE